MLSNQNNCTYFCGNVVQKINSQFNTFFNISSLKDNTWFTLVFYRDQWLMVYSNKTPKQGTRVGMRYHVNVNPNALHMSIWAMLGSLQQSIWAKQPETRKNIREWLMSEHANRTNPSRSHQSWHAALPATYTSLMKGELTEHINNRKMLPLISRKIDGERCLLNSGLFKSDNAVNETHRVCSKTVTRVRLTCCLSHKFSFKRIYVF